MPSWMAVWKQRHTHREAERKRDRCIGVQRHVDGLRAVLQIRVKLAFRPPCGSPVTVIVMRAWLAVTGVPPVVHCRKNGIVCCCFVCNGRQTGFTTRDFVAENGHKNRSTLGVSCRSGIFGYLYMDEIMTVRTVLPF